MTVGYQNELSVYTKGTLALTKAMKRIGRAACFIVHANADSPVIINMQLLTSCDVLEGDFTDICRCMHNVVMRGGV